MSRVSVGFHAPIIRQFGHVRKIIAGMCETCLFVCYGRTMTNKQVSDTGAEEYIFPRIASKMLHVDPRTLQRMAERGEVEAIKLPSGHRRYLRESIEAIREGRAA